MLRILQRTVAEFTEDECPRLAAALSYYAIFSLPALLALVVTIAGLFAGREQVAGRLLDYFRDALGSAGTDQIEIMLQRAAQPGQGLWNSIVGLAMLAFGATGVLSELQTALNRAWGVQPDPRHNTWQTFFWKRTLSLGMVLGIAFLLLISLVVSWVLAEFGGLLQRASPAWLSAGSLWALDGLATFGINTLLFAALLRFLPDVELRWRDVWAGAILTALLFALGKFALGLYLAWIDVTSAYGAAGSLALVMVWIYYSATIFFLGAEFTQVLAAERGQRVVPEAGAELHTSPKR